MFKKKSRQALVVYLNYYRDAKKVLAFGDLIYKSRRGRYLILYVDAETVDSLIEQLRKEKFVRQVLPSYLQDLDQNVVGSLWREESSPSD